MNAGQSLPEIAAAALKAIFTDNQNSYQVTLQNRNAEGITKWTKYEMWRVFDHAEGSPALLLSTLNVTHQKELELQVEASKLQLQR